jgi:hypothetical protein
MLSVFAFLFWFALPLWFFMSVAPRLAWCDWTAIAIVGAPLLWFMVMFGVGPNLVFVVVLFLIVWVLLRLIDSAVGGPARPPASRSPSPPNPEPREEIAYLGVVVQALDSIH